MDLKSFFEKKVILVVGGTGTIGTEIVNQLLKLNPNTIRIFSNSENELWEMQIRMKEHISKLRFLLGDIRNFNRIKRAMIGVDYIFNAAAIKHVPISEYNPMEAINVNIKGLEHVIEAAFLYNVKKMVHISTDKAVNPTTAMGATKMLGERLCISRSQAKGIFNTVIACVRFGNVLGSRGSIIPLIKKQIDQGNSVTLTSEGMKRFFMSISQAVELVIQTMTLSQDGDIFVLKMPTVKIKDLIEIIIEEYAPTIDKDPKSIQINVIGPRPGEKIDEDLISEIEYPYCEGESDKYMKITPSIQEITRKNGEISEIEEKIKKFYSTQFASPLGKEKIREKLKELKLL